MSAASVQAFSRWCADDRVHGQPRLVLMLRPDTVDLLDVSMQSLHRR